MDTARSVKLYPYLGFVKTVIAVIVIVDICVFFEYVVQVTIGVRFNLKNNPRAALNGRRMACENVTRKIVNNEHLAKAVQRKHISRFGSKKDSFAGVSSWHSGGFSFQQVLNRFNFGF